MLYPIIPIVLVTLFFFYIFYLLLIKKDIKKLKTIVFPGLFFITIWAVIYYFLLK